MSERVTIRLERPVKPDMVEDLSKRIVYCSARLRDFRFDLERNEASFELAEAAAAVDTESREQIADKARRFIEDMSRGFRPLPRKVLFEHRHPNPRFQPDVLEEMEKRGWVWQLASGQMGLGGEAEQLFQRLDRIVRQIALDEFGAVEERYPTLIPADTLCRCGYFTSFPQSVNFVTHIHEDYDVINGFIDANQEQEQLVLPEGALKAPAHGLSPAVCYHAYASVAGNALAQPKTVTAQGKCFRYESSNMTGLERLWDFTMREIIFIGEGEWVAERRQRCIERVGVLLAEMGLSCSVESANDPFFVQDFATKTYYQFRGDLKFEIRMHVAPDRTIAVGSFNLHEDFFGKAFSIEAAGRPACTGCAGFGLERWVYAFICQHGLDPAQWPTIPAAGATPALR